MPHEPKLEIFKLKLSNKQDNKPIQLRELCRKKFNNYTSIEYAKIPRPLDEANILTIFYTDLITKIDLNSFNKNEKKKKGFTLASNMVGEDRHSEIRMDTGKNIFWGNLEGGAYGRIRTLNEIDDKQKGSSIKINHLIGDKFYFLLYTPLNENILILMIQGYTESRIADVFVKFLEEHFSYLKEIKCTAEHFVPRSLKDKYIKGATFKSLTFSSGWNVKANFDDDIVERDYKLEVQITVTDKSAEKANHKSVHRFLESIGLSKFKLTNTGEKPLKDFEGKKGKMQSKGKDFPIDFDDENEIRPTILLTEEGIKIGEGLIPDFKEIDTYCKRLLDEVITELNPANAVGRL